MPLEVSPECFIQLCQRVNILHLEKRKGILLAQVKATGKYCSIMFRVADS